MEGNEPGNHSGPHRCPARGSPRPARGTDEPSSQGVRARAVPVGIGRRVVVVANLGLKPEATASTSWAGAGLARALDAWQGPGAVVVAGNLFDISGRSDPAEAVSASLLTHRDVADALKNFASGTERQVLCIPGSADRVLGEDAVARHPLDELGVEVASAVDLHLKSGAGTRWCGWRLRSRRSRPRPRKDQSGGPRRSPPTACPQVRRVRTARRRRGPMGCRWPAR